MARFDVTGMEQAIKSLEKLGDGAAPVADAMLHAAGSVMVEGWQYSAAKHRHIRTGAMYDSIKATKPKIISGVRTIYVYPQGTDKQDRNKPVRNAEKAFVLNYGRNNMDADHWAEEAEDVSEAPAQEAMENVFDGFLLSGNVPPAAGNGAYRSSGPIGAATFHQG